jgi:hypothetical protein
LQALSFPGRSRTTKRFCNANETIFDLDAELLKPRLVKRAPEIGGRRSEIPEAVKMRSLSFILALAFLLAGVTLADQSDSGVPGIGTFAYGAPHKLADASSVIVAER